MQLPDLNRINPLLQRWPMNGKYSCIAKFSNTCLEYGASYSYSEQVFENFSMQLYFPFIGNLSKSQQYLSTTETSKHSLILVLQLTLMTFMNIYNGFYAVNGQLKQIKLDYNDYDRIHYQDHESATSCTRGQKMTQNVLKTKYVV